MPHMETHFSFLLLIPVLSIFLFFGLTKRKNNEAKIQIPPGPWKLPLLGNLHQLVAAAGGSSSPPHHTLRDLSLKYGPLMHLQIGELSTVVASSPDLAKQIMKTHDLSFVHRPLISSAKIFAYGATDIAFAPYGDYWRQMKKICILELLSSKKVQSFSYVRQDEVCKLIDTVRSSVGSVVDLTDKIYSLTSAMVTKVAFGNEHEELLQLLYAALEVGGFHFVDFFPSLKHVHLITAIMEAKLVKIHNKVDKILEDILKENREKQIRSAEGGCCESTGSEEENLVQVLLRIQQSGNLDVTITNDNIKAVIWVSTPWSTIKLFLCFKKGKTNLLIVLTELFSLTVFKVLTQLKFDL